MNKTQTEARAAYEAAQISSKDHHMGSSCMNYPCKGTMGPTEDPSRLLECAVCGAGLRYPTFEKWVTGKIQGSDYTARTNKEAIEYAKDEIKALQMQIITIKETNRERGETIKTAKAEASKYRKVQRGLK